MQVAIRVAALPASALEELRFHRSWAAVSEIVALGQWLREEGTLLSDELYPIIGGAAAASVKPRLVALRRAVYGIRRLPPRIWNTEVRLALPVGLGVRVEAWDSRYRDREALLAGLPELMEAETVTANARLRESLRDPAFRFGLVQGSSVLFEELTKWLRDPGEGAPQRQTLLRLAKYLARVVAKTSPYSTFTVSGLVPWREEVDQALRPTGAFDWTSVAELNVWLVKRLTDALLRDPALVRRIGLRENPSLVQHGELIRFLGPGPQTPLVTVRDSPALGECLRAVREREGVTLAEVCRHLIDIDPDLAEEQVAGFVGRLVETGLLHAVSPYPDQAGDHLGELIGWLEAADGADADALVKELRLLQEELRGYPEISESEARLERHERVYGRFSGLVAGAEEAPQPVPRKNLFHENAVFVTPVAECGPRAWAPIIDDLTRLRDVITVFDPCLAGRRALGHVFAATYGDGGTASWLDFYQLVGRVIAAGDTERVGGLTGTTLQTLCMGPLNTAAEQWRELPFAAEQALAIERATAAVIDAGADEHGVTRMTAEALEQAMGPAPRAPGPAGPLACYLQLLGTGTEPRAVVNAVITGYGRAHSRIVRLMRQADAAEAVGDWPLIDRTAGGDLLAESSGLFASNLNLRAAVAGHELDYPFTTPSTSDRPRIPLRDLDVAHDPATGLLRLVSRTSGQAVLPIHGGMMAEFWLPGPVRHLVEAFGPAPSYLHASVPMFLPPEVDPRAGGVQMLPRLEVGSVTLMRRCWAFPAADMPSRRGGESDGTFWLRLADWLAERGIPERFYVRVIANELSSYRVELKSRKPTYVDCAVWHLVALLERSIGDPRDLVVFTEALPDLADAPAYGTARRVTELIVEVPGD